MGSALILAMVVLIVLASLALMLGQSMRVEAAGSASYVAQVQAQAVADGAVEYVRALLAQTPGQIPDQDPYDSQAVPIGVQGVAGLSGGGIKGGVGGGVGG